MIGATSSVFIVDDSPVVRLGLVRALNEQPDLFACGTSDLAEDAEVAVRRAAPQLVLLEFGESGDPGLVQRLVPFTPVLVFSAYAEEAYVERALKAGAAGFVAKREPLEVLLQAIRSALRGGRYISECTAMRPRGRRRSVEA